MTSVDEERSEAGAVAREPGVSLWRQIARTVEAEIAKGVHQPGGRLPTEAQFSARFNVNRHTVRRALEELSRSGLVVIEQGRGSFVAEDVIDYTIVQRPRFSEWIREQNKEPSGRVLDLREIAADSAAALALGVRTGARLIRLERLGFADGRPIGMTSHHFSAARFPTLMAILGETMSVAEALASAGVAEYRRKTTRVTARLPTGSEADLLKMPRNRPVLVTESINVDLAGHPVEFGVSRHPTPRVQIVFEP